MNYMGEEESTYSLVANTGIHITSFPFEIKEREKFEVWFHELYDTENGKWILSLIQPITTETTDVYYYNKKELYDGGFLPIINQVDVQDLYDDGINPIKVNDDEMQKGMDGDIFKFSFSDRSCILSSFEGKWLPVPYFSYRSKIMLNYGPLNWSRFKLVPTEQANDGTRRYKVLLAFDTHTQEVGNKYNECPVFPNKFDTEVQFAVCDQEFLLLDYCSPRDEWDYIDKYLLHLAHPNASTPEGIKKKRRKLSYIATYFLLIDYIAKNKLFPKVVLYKDKGVATKDVDMVVDIGNSRTTALLVEDNSDFNQVSLLQLTDFTAMNETGSGIKIYQEPFDMRLALRKVWFGDFGIRNSRQFVYPSIVRLGKEAERLIHIATEKDSEEKYTTMSSPKRYLWDGKKSVKEWKFITFDGEADDDILYISGISEQLNSDGTVCSRGEGGQSYHYSRRSMMTFAFLEMLAQAEMQINSDKYRRDRGEKNKPRHVRRIIVTCPTAMSKLEREALVKCASDAVKLYNNFNGNQDNRVEIIPAAPKFSDTDSQWYYDEATCSQLVYIYGEVGYKYKGACQEFFNLYGHKEQGKQQSDLIVGSLDIGAGTSDLMINRYSYDQSITITTIKPEPLFYDSYYYAGDDMLNDMIRNIMFFSPRSALRKNMKELTESEYKQKLRNFFGPNYSGQTIAQRHLRRDFNLQYSIPLMYCYLDLSANNASDCTVSFKEVFEDNEPSSQVKEGFRDAFGFSMEEMLWEYNKKEVSEVISKSFEPLLMKIATIMYSYKCDVILLSGRPASLSPIRNLVLKYYPVSPNRLILLNNYFVGHWYPFGENTGYIKNAKTIVAMGALIGYYATTLGNLKRFAIDKSLLDEKLKSVVNYIEATRDRLPIEYFITPEKKTGDLQLTSLPTILYVRQLGIASYPSRALYLIDFNYHQISERVRTQAIQKGQMLTDNEVEATQKDIINNLRLRMPFQLSIEQDEDNKEKLSIVSVTDKDGNDINVNNIEINIQSLGVYDYYWLDSGAFEIQ